jgi:hypothetical protein
LAVCLEAAHPHALAATLEHRHLSALEHYRHAQQLGLQLLVAEPGDIADDDRIAALSLLT